MSREGEGEGEGKEERGVESVVRMKSQFGQIALHSSSSFLLSPPSFFVILFFTRRDLVSAHAALSPSRTVTSALSPFSTALLSSVASSSVRETLEMEFEEFLYEEQEEMEEEEEEGGGGEERGGEN